MGFFVLGAVWTKSPMAHDTLGNNTELVLDTDLQARDAADCVDCAMAIASAAATWALTVDPTDACAVVACAQDEIGSDDDCYDCVCSTIGSMCDTCSGSPVSGPHFDQLFYIVLAVLTMKLYDLV